MKIEKTVNSSSEPPFAYHTLKGAGKLVYDLLMALLPKATNEMRSDEAKQSKAYKTSQSFNNPLPMDYISEAEDPLRSYSKQVPIHHRNETTSRRGADFRSNWVRTTEYNATKKLASGTKRCEEKFNIKTGFSQHDLRAINRTLCPVRVTLRLRGTFSRRYQAHVSFQSPCKKNGRKIEQRGNSSV